MEILIFGIGQAYKNRKFYFENNSSVHIIGFIDNNESTWGEVFEGEKVYSPGDLKDLKFDAIVLLSNRYYIEQRNQLINIGVSADKIWDYYHLKKVLLQEDQFDTNDEITKDDIVIISFQLGINGGSLAIIYLAEAINNKIGKVCIAADYISEEARKVVARYGFRTIECRSLPYMPELFLKKMETAKCVIVNTLQMLPSAILLKNSGVPTCLWVHEGEEIWYKAVSRSVEEKDIPKDLPIIFVSSVSKALFQKYYGERKGIIVPVALPDRTFHEKRSCDRKLTIAVIGANTRNKNPILLIRALKELPDNYRNKVCVNFYGIDDSGKYSLEKEADGYVSIKIYGIIPPEKLHRKLDDTDCVVCTSLQESLSMTAIEGFMHKCIVVVPDSAGIASYITDREDGFLYDVNDTEALARCIKEIIEMKGDNSAIKEKSRALYEKYFMYDELRAAFMNIFKEI